MIQTYGMQIKAVLRRTFIAIQSNFTKQKKVSYSLILHLKQLEKEEQTKSKRSRQKEIIKIRGEINKIETKKTIAKINEAKCWFSAKIKITDKPLAKLNKKIKGRRLKSIKLEMKKEVATNSTEIPQITREYYEHLHANETENLEEMDKFLETCSHPRQEDIENMNRPFTSTYRN